MRNHYVTANLATYPPRKKFLESVLSGILPQVDRLNIYLNEYESVPDILIHPKINVVLGKDAAGDLKDNGKFFFLDIVPEDSYYFTIDDDIIYPSDYVERMIHKLVSLENKVVVGVHGIVFHQEFESFRNTRKTFYFGHGLDRDVHVSALGTGTMAFHRDLFKDFLLSSLKTAGMADLWMAIFSKKHHIPLVCIEREGAWLKSIDTDHDTYSSTLWNESAKNEDEQNKIIRQYRLWEIASDGGESYRSCIESITTSKFDDKLKELDDDFRLLLNSKSFLLGNLFFRSIRSPKKILTFPINFLRILLRGGIVSKWIFVFVKKTQNSAFVLLSNLKKNFRKSRPLKVLAVVNHYYGEGKDFNGKSTSQNIDTRKKIIEQVLSGLRCIPGIDIKICGIKASSLVDVDVDFSGITDPSFLIYESIQWMADQSEKYDYFINIEDDILLDRETFERIVEFDRKNKTSECFHPNRMEYKDGEEYCVDLNAMPGWEDAQKKYAGHILRVAKNPHSGVAILSKEKLLYAKKRVDFSRRDKIIGHYMASAYANLHAPFLMYRSFDDQSFHKVIHLDNWEPK